MKQRTRRNAAQSRETLLAAATEEFASHGLAGARIDRIAQAAGISKPMLYTYFGDKEALFDAALTQEVMDAAQADRFDPNDLEGYAGRTYDLLVERPRLWRLLTWHHLERGQDVLMLPAGEVLLGEPISLLWRDQPVPKSLQNRRFPYNHRLTRYHGGSPQRPHFGGTSGGIIC